MCFTRFLFVLLPCRSCLVDEIAFVFLAPLNEAYFSTRQHPEEYFLLLKEMVQPDKWREFYHELLNCGASSFQIERAAPFLVMENEYDWYFTLIKDHFNSFLQHAKALLPTHEKEMKELIMRSFRAYAASRFTPKRRVKSSKYTHLCEALSCLPELGMARELKELVAYFHEEYPCRRALLQELSAIQLPY